MNEEQKALFCDEYCKYPYYCNEIELQEKCEQCPLNEEQDENSLIPTGKPVGLSSNLE